LEDHDPVTRWVVQELGEPIKARAAGGDLHPKLEEFLEMMETTSLDESCGEGWHRGSQYEKKRAYSSVTASLKRSVRRKGVFLRLKKFKRMYGKRAEPVLRFEYKNWKRILAKPSRRWHAKRMPDNEAFGRIYREGASSEVNWSNIVSRMQVHAVATEDVGTLEASQNEYLRSQVKPGDNYGFDLPGQDAEGGSVAIVPWSQEPHLNFRLLGMQHGKKRAHVMPTVDDPEDISKVASLAWHVQFQTRRSRGEDEDPLPAATLEVYEDGDPQWVRPRDLASFDTLQTQLMVYRKELESQVKGCLLLSDRHLARPMQALMDKDCPVLILVQQLRRKGWKAVDRKIVHENTTVAPFDSEEATRKKKYFQCLWVLDQVMPLTTALPSREPVAYYELLLHGLRAEPGKQAKEYQLVVNRELRKKGQHDRIASPGGPGPGVRPHSRPY